MCDGAEAVNTSSMKRVWSAGHCSLGSASFEGVSGAFGSFVMVVTSFVYARLSIKLKVILGLRKRRVATTVSVFVK